MCKKNFFKRIVQHLHHHHHERQNRCHIAAEQPSKTTTMAKTKFIPFVFAFFFTSSYTICNAHNKNEVDDESKFTYLLGTTEGPQHWSMIKSEWKLCETGKFQSPINIRNKTVKITTIIPHLKPNYKSAPAMIVNRGHDIKLQWEQDAGGINIDGVEYKLQQCHWHTPSEHKVDGKWFAMEAHMVHQSAGGKTAVVAIPFKIGAPNPFLDTLIHHVKTVDDKGLKLGLIDPSKLGVKDEPFYRYIGSLTVPPCTEGIIWNVLYEVRTLSMEQMMALRNAVHDGYEANSRPVQGLHRRPVYLAM